MSVYLYNGPTAQREREREWNMQHDAGPFSSRLKRTINTNQMVMKGSLATVSQRFIYQIKSEKDRIKNNIVAEQPWEPPQKAFCSGAEHDCSHMGAQLYGVRSRKHMCQFLRSRISPIITFTGKRKYKS